MEFVPTFVLSILGVMGRVGVNPARMRLIVRRPYAHLEQRLRRAFEGRDDVEVVTDRRRGERRMGDRQRPLERRRAHPRTPYEGSLEGGMQGDPPTAMRLARAHLRTS